MAGKPRRSLPVVGGFPYGLRAHQPSDERAGSSDRISFRSPDGLAQAHGDGIGPQRSRTLSSGVDALPVSAHTRLDGSTDERGGSIDLA